MHVKLRNINKSFGEKIIFDNYNLDIPKNKIIGIFGSSGSGKTTLLNIIGLIENIDQGCIYYKEEIINPKKDRQRLLQKEIGFIFQNFGLLDSATVKDNLSILMKLDKLKKSEKEKKIYDILKKFKLEDKLNTTVHSLSGGEQQRIAIAKILLKDCPLILADEPTASLDFENKKFVLEQFIKLKETGKTIVLVSHDMSITDYCDTIIEL